GARHRGEERSSGRRAACTPQRHSRDFRVDEPAQRRRVARPRGLRGELLCCTELDAVSLAPRHRREMDDRGNNATNTLLRLAGDRCEPGSRGWIFLVRCPACNPGAKTPGRYRDSDGTTITTKGVAK